MILGRISDLHKSDLAIQFHILAKVEKEKTNQKEKSGLKPGKVKRFLKYWKQYRDIWSVVKRSNTMMRKSAMRTMQVWSRHRQNLWILVLLLLTGKYGRHTVLYCAVLYHTVLYYTIEETSEHTYNNTDKIKLYLLENRK